MKNCLFFLLIGITCLPMLGFAKDQIQHCIAIDRVLVKNAGSSKPQVRNLGQYILCAKEGDKNAIDLILEDDRLRILKISR